MELSPLLQKHNTNDNFNVYNFYSQTNQPQINAQFKWSKYFVSWFIYILCSILSPADYYTDVRIYFTVNSVKDTNTDQLDVNIY